MMNCVGTQTNEQQPEWPMIADEGDLYLDVGEYLAFSEEDVIIHQCAEENYNQRHQVLLRANGFEKSFSTSSAGC